MMGLFSRFSGVKIGHRRTQSAIDVRGTVSSSSRAEEATADPPAPVTTSSSHGSGVAMEFKPVEHPTEPVIHDQPVRCPLPEPSILNDGRVWKERMSARVKGSSSFGSESSRTRSSGSARHAISHSLSVPEKNPINVLVE